MGPLHACAPVSLHTRVHTCEQAYTNEYTQRRPGRESKRAVLARDELKSVMLAEVLTQTGPTGLWTMNYSLGLLSP